MLDLVFPPILACPHCTYKRFLPTWILFAGLRLSAVLIIGCRSFDLVRLLGLFVAFEIVYYLLWSAGSWISHPAVSGGLISGVFLLGLLVLIAGVPAMFVMRFASRYPYFTRPGSPKFTWLQASALLPLMIGIAFIEAIHTS